MRMLLQHLFSLKNLFSNMACCKMHKISLIKRGLVSATTTWCADGIFRIKIAPSNSSYLTQKCLIWICLLRLWYSGFCVLQLHCQPSTLVNTLYPTLLRIEFLTKSIHKKLHLQLQYPFLLQKYQLKSVFDWGTCNI